MKRLFFAVVAVDVVALSLPTGWMGYRAEMGLAISLVCTTALLWLCLRVGQGSP